jgi:hypothetical protein
MARLEDMKKKLKLFIYLPLLLIAFSSCNNNDKVTYVLLLNNRDCINCEEGAIKKVSDSHFHELLIEKSVIVVFPNIRKIEQEKIVEDYNLQGISVKFNDGEYTKYQTMLNSTESALIKLENDSIVKYTAMGKLNIYNVDVFDE